MFQPQPTPYSSFAYGAQNDQIQSNPSQYFESSRFRPYNGGPIVFENPVFSPVGGFRPLPMNLDQERFDNMNTPPTDDLAAQEVLARAYEPEIKGRLVGEKKSSLAITEEYAKADPIYVAKTSVLPETYSHYRPIRGDGNCGWRAIGFSYFETLVKLGDKKLFASEYARMTALTDFVVEMCGHEAWIFEDMRDQCRELLQDVAAVILEVPQPNLDSLILERFNDAEVSDGIVYWLRLLASAYLKSRATDFEGFIPGLTGVDNYCKEVLEPTNYEIEHLGMTLLIEVLLKPIGVAVEICYLDRSHGSHVNVHTISPDTPNAAGSMIHLLYRPGHYDILYAENNLQTLSQQQILQAAATHSNPQVNRVANLSHRHSIQGTPADYADVDVSILVNMPSFFGPLTTHHGFHEPFTTSSAFTPTSSHAPSYPVESATTRTPQSISPVPSDSPATSIFSPTSLPILSPSQTVTTSDLVNSPGALSPTAISPGPLSPGAPKFTQGASQFRPSMYQYRDDWGDGPAQGFQTSTFKNSHYNVSHYNNPNFQPEQWTPDCDEAVGKLTRRGTA